MYRADDFAAGRCVDYWMCCWQEDRRTYQSVVIVMSTMVSACIKAGLCGSTGRGSEGLNTERAASAEDSPYP
jgi:hypothetical protein